MQENLNLTKYSIENGGRLVPMILPPEVTGGSGLMNPSIFVHNGEIYVNIRHVNYTLYHSEKKKYHHQFGPLQYLHSESDRFLKTTNFLCKLDSDYKITDYTIVDTTANDVAPRWEFIGLEDARLFVWDDKFYLCGVRRDTTTNGEGRMELSEIEITEKYVREISRNRIPIPAGTFSYCEKNWMPIVDCPFHWVKWTNPTEVVKYDIENKTTSTVFHSGEKVDIKNDLRGGSQVIKYGDYYLCVTHEVFLYNSELGRKDGRYRHRFVLWDKNWKIVAYSRYFNFMDAEIEFCCGAQFYGDNLLISFGFQDNGAYILEFPVKLLDNMFIYDTREKLKNNAVIIHADETCKTTFVPKDRNILNVFHGNTLPNDVMYDTIIIPANLAESELYRDVSCTYVAIVGKSDVVLLSGLKFLDKHRRYKLSDVNCDNGVVIFEQTV